MNAIDYVYRFDPQDLRVYNLCSDQVMMLHDRFAPPSDENRRLVHAPANPREFSSLAIRLAEILRLIHGRAKSLESVEKEIVAYSFQSDGMQSEAAGGGK